MLREILSGLRYTVFVAPSYTPPSVPISFAEDAESSNRTKFTSVPNTEFSSFIRLLTDEASALLSPASPALTPYVPSLLGVYSFLAISPLSSVCSVVSCA